MKKLIGIFYSIYHWLLSFGGALWFCFPSRKITVIGITGTKGKTTTVALISDILEKGGQKTAFVSSDSIKIGSSIQKNRTGNSMPGKFFLQQFLHKAVLEGCTTAIIEVTSQGVIQHRHKFIFWDRAVFLNIHPEHIEAHGSFENYLSAKVSFFDYVAKHHYFKKPQFIINKDDQNWVKFAKAARGFNVVYFSVSDLGNLKINIPERLSGDFNKSNIAAAVAIAKSLNVSDLAIKGGIENFAGVEGRMEVVVSSPFTCVVDYAHTPVALEAVYQFWHSKKRPEGKLICVLGSAGGGRDKWKRPKLGEIATKYCDYIILTNEDPYDEDPEEILNQIEKGIIQFSSKTPFVKIIDRRQAIEKALLEAKKGDVVICTGKGSEEFIHLKKGKKIPWSDKKVILECINKKSQ